MTSRPFKPTPARSTFMRHRQAVIYFTFKHPWPMQFTYSLSPKALWAECPPAKMDDIHHQFDVRDLPERYRENLPINTGKTLADPVAMPQEFWTLAIQLERYAHRLAIFRALEDGFDILAHQKKVWKL